MEERMTVLQTLSIKIMVQPSPEALLVFMNEIRNLDSAAVGEFQNCLLFPAISLLRKRQTVYVFSLRLSL